MLKRGDIKKYFIIIVCLLVILPMPSVLTSSVALSEELKLLTEKLMEEDEQLQIASELSESSDASEELVLSLVDLDGSSFNVTEMVINISEMPSDLEQLLLIVSLNEEEEKFINVELDTNNKVKEKNVELNDLKEGTYSIYAKGTLPDGNIVMSNEVVFEILLSKPEIEIHTPYDNFSNSAVISGQTKNELQLSVIIDDSTLVLNEEEDLDFMYDEEGNFSFDLSTRLEENELVEIRITAEDVVGNLGYVDVSFFYDVTRPFVSPGSLYPRPKMTQVPVEDLEIKFQIIDEHIDIKEIIEKQPIKLLDLNGEIPGVVNFDEKTNTFTFIPDPEKLNSLQKYHVIINPLLADKAGNYIHPRSWSFTTAKKKPGFSIMSTGISSAVSPHGNYLNNTNTCSTCHSTHAGTGPRLEGVNVDLQEKLEQFDQVTAYCMACHDGTAASAMPENIDQHAVSNHNKVLITKDGEVVNQSCGSCHNVHLETHESNPNLLKDHITFNHTGIPGTGNLGLISSSERLCESCHESNLQEIYLSSGVKYQVFPYRNHNTSIEDLDEGQLTFGASDDYLLCLRCHNSDYKQQYQNIVDISSLYNIYSYDFSGHYITNDRVKDGSLLDGNMPCADCHETHGSATNVGLLKSELGHNNTTEFTQTGEWTIADERRLCISCHNNDTELYGITVEYDGHGPSNRSCSYCHGGGDFIRAVHAPTGG